RSARPARRGDLPRGRPGREAHRDRAHRRSAGTERARPVGGQANAKGGRGGAMIADVITIFPAMVEAALAEGVIGRARERGTVEIRVRDLLAYADDRHHVVDDMLY